MEWPILEVPATIDVPLRRDPDGTIRIGKTRVLLEVLLGAYERGDTPEEIHEGFPTVSLPEILAVLAYYEANREQVDEYIRKIDEEAERRKQEFLAEHPEEEAYYARLRKILEERQKQEQP